LLNTSNYAVQLSPPLLVHFFLLIDKEAAENVEYDGKAVEQAEKIKLLLPGIAGKLKILICRPVSAVFVSKCSTAMCERLHVGVTSKAAANSVHLEKNWNVRMR
jgi:hypothetical protein